MANKQAVTWRIQHAGALMPIVGFDVICWRCTGGITLYVPISDFNLDAVMTEIENKMINTPRGWLCRHCAANVGITAIQVEEVHSGCICCEGVS